jgi:phospholipid/cholesterol/gamma-HCH transport system permease protein
VQPRTTIPYDPRRDEAPSPGWIGSVGRSAIGLVRQGRALLRTLVDALVSDFVPGRAARAQVHRIMLTQILYSGVQAVSLVSVIGFLIGATIVIQANLMMPADGEILGRILVAVVLRELAPLITAVVVAGRSGTAIATELGNMKVNSEVFALAALGIDPPRFIVLPRLVASVVSVLSLMVYFSFVSVTAAFLVAVRSTGVSFSSLQSGLASGLMPFDIGLFLLKGVGLGVIVGWFCCHFGLEVKSSPTEVPRQASRAVVMVLVTSVAYNAALTAAFYWLLGPPLPAP